MSSFLRASIRQKKYVDRKSSAFQTASCNGKLRFSSFSEAQRNVPQDVRSTAAGKGRLAPYKCSFCNSYHIGRSSFESAIRHETPRPYKKVELVED